MGSTQERRFIFEYETETALAETRIQVVRIDLWGLRLLHIELGLNRAMKRGPDGPEEAKPVVDQTPEHKAAAIAFERFGLQNKSCVVTGGTKGIGAAIVVELASLKVKVCKCSDIDRSCISSAHS